MYECTLFDNFAGKIVTERAPTLFESVKLAYRRLLESQMDPQDAAAVDCNDDCRCTLPSDESMQATCSLSDVDPTSSPVFVVVSSNPEPGPLGFVRRIA